MALTTIDFVFIIAYFILVYVVAYVKTRKKSEEEFEKQKEAFKKELNEAKVKLETNRQAAQKASSQAVSELHKEIINIIAAVADEQGYDVILDQKNVIIADKSLNITEVVLKELDSKVKKIKVSFDN